MRNTRIEQLSPRVTVSARQRIRPYLQLMRLDHSLKQVFVLPGIVLAAMMSSAVLTPSLWGHCILGLISITLVASSNYVLNEVLDAPTDRMHPTKRLRPAACGDVNEVLAYQLWLALGGMGLFLAHRVSTGLFVCCLCLWIMGCLYNIPPVRTKDVPYLDVTSEALNNPIRFCAGWYMITSVVVPPVSVLITYWLLGAYFMALKRFSEYRQIGPECAGFYRRSFMYYSERSLLNSVVFYAASSMLFFGAFIMRYKLELVLAFPVIALLMAVYFNLAFKPDSPVQNPERLITETRLMLLFGLCIVLSGILLFAHIPLLSEMFAKSVSK